MGTKARALELQYFRDIDGREVDFIITENDIPILAIECKSSDTTLGRGLCYFKHHLPECAAYQIAWESNKDY